MSSTCVLSKSVFSLLNPMVPGNKTDNNNKEKRKYENKAPILCVRGERKLRINSNCVCVFCPSAF